MIAYLSKQTDRVFKNFSDARNDAKIYIALKSSTSFKSYDKAKQFAEHEISEQPSKYIQTVFVYI